VDAVVMRGTPAASKAAVAVKDPVQRSEVLALHKQLETISSRLQGMLNTKDGALAHAKVKPTLEIFLKELQTVLTETASEKVPPALAFQKLQVAKQGVAGLMGELTSRQESLMKEDSTQRESLLLGVLMSNQKEPMEKQVEILKDDDFSGLEVAKALLKEHNSTTALYVQAAAYLDKHPNRKPAPMTTASKSSNSMASVQSMLEKRLESLQHEYDVHEKFHKQKAADFAAELKAAPKKGKHHVETLAKREDRNFKKWAALRMHDINAMKDAVAGVKKGDMKAVARARNALEASLKALQGQTGGFLYFIQLGHKLVNRDCPYCVAQCVDKCHQDGNPYVQCLTSCADAGKGK
jgi:hypothetical protein